MEHTKTCEFCGKSFQASRTDARFCSANCRTGANKMKKRFERSDGSVIKPVVSDPVRSGDGMEKVLFLLHSIIERLSDQEEVYLTPGQVCEFLSISKTTFDRYVRKGLLKTYYLRGKESKTKKKVYVKKSDILSLFQENI